jgi:hypothetical protein
MKKPLLLVLVALVPALAGCNDCDRAGCDSFSKRASAGIAQGVAGAVSVESDAVADGCQVCAFSEAGLEIWPAPADGRLAPGAAACPLMAAPAFASLTALEHYERQLDPGQYLICVVGGKDRPCIGIAVTAGQVTTLNVKHVYGPSIVAVLDPGSTAFRSDSFTCP